MWPWEHILLAYVFYSLYVHVRHHSRPEDWPVTALAFGSVFPDLVDKPLAWQFGLLDTGRALAHSVFVAVPLSLVVYALARRRGSNRTGFAFGFGYLLHLVGDVLPSSLTRGTLYLDPVLWPFADPDHAHGSLSEEFSRRLIEYAFQLLTMEPTPVLVLQLGSVVFGLGLWLYDGRPGLRPLVALLRRAVDVVLLR